MQTVGSRSTRNISKTAQLLLVAMAEQQGKRDSEMVEAATTTEEQMPTSKGEVPLMRSKADELSVWQSALAFKRVGLIAMTAAFCAALDGYRKTRLAKEAARP